MTIQDLLSILKELDRLKCKGGKIAKAVQQGLDQEATTHNVLKLKELLEKLKDK